MPASSSVPTTTTTSRWLSFLVVFASSLVMMNSVTALLVVTRPSRSKTLSRRTLSSLAATISPASSSSSSSSPLLDPSANTEPLVYPKSLSPSSITTFQQCPQSYLFQYLMNMPQPNTLALLKGKLTHSALEQLFDLKPSDRTLENAHNLLRKNWSQQRTKAERLELFAREQVSEVDWGRECLQLLDNYMRVEDPVLLPQPAQREVWVRAVLSNHDDDNGSPILVRGIVDRLDLVRSYHHDNNNNSQTSFRITDYKTGKAPHLKYSPAFNQKIRQEAFFQLQIYALLLNEMRAAKRSASATDNDSDTNMEPLPVTQLRLLYLTSGSGQAILWDDAVGDLQETKQQVLGVWKQIRDLVDGQDLRAFVGCSRSFCHCHKCRPLFVPGSVWEPPL